MHDTVGHHNILCINELHHLKDLVLELDLLVLQAVNCACRRLSKGSQASRGALQLRDQRQCTCGHLVDAHTVSVGRKYCRLAAKARGVELATDASARRSSS